MDEHSEIRHLATTLAETVTEVRGLAARLSPIPEKFAELSTEVRGLKTSMEDLQRRIQSGDSAFEDLRKQQALHAARLDKLEESARLGRSKAWELFVAVLPYLLGGAGVGFVLWLKSLGH